MARPKAVALAGGDRRQVRQYAVLEVEQLERAGVFGLAAAGIVAARNEDRHPVGGGRQHLVPEDAGVDARWLLYLLAEGAVPVDAVDGDTARIIVGDQ